MNDDGEDRFFYGVLAVIAVVILCMVFVPACQPMHIDPRW